MSRNISTTVSTFVTIQKFLCAFLDRLSKAKMSIEQIDPEGKDLGDIRQLSTRIIQQWNILFPNSLIQTIDDMSTNTLIATKTREEVVLDRSTRQKQKLIMEIEVLRSRLNQQEKESISLNEEINNYNKQIETEDNGLQRLHQQRHALVNTLSSLQTQKQRETTELQSLQETKLAILEELVNIQRTLSALRTSVTALQEEKEKQQRQLEKLQNEQLLLSHELQAMQQQRQSIDMSIQQTKELITQSEECLNNTNTRTSGLSTFTPHDPGFDTIVIKWNRLSGRRRYHRERSQAEGFCSTKRRITNDSNIFADDSFWYSFC